MPRFSEESLYKKEFALAKENLSRWRALGRQLKNTNNLDWKGEHEKRKEAVREMGMLMRAARTSDKVRRRSSS